VYAGIVTRRETPGAGSRGNPARAAVSQSRAMSERRRYKVKYQYGPYSGVREVWAEDPESAIRRLWSQFSRDKLLTLPMAHKSARVITEKD
jgi:hypothetical protein